MTNKKIHNLNTELGSARLNTFIIITVITIMISATIFQNINEKLEKMAYFFHNFRGVIAAKGFTCNPPVTKDIIKL